MESEKSESHFSIRDCIDAFYEKQVASGRAIEGLFEGLMQSGFKEELM
jgi:hypothetical protein